MSKLTLRDYQSKSIKDLFMAVIVEEISDEEAKRHMESLTPQDKDYQKVKELEDIIDSTTSEAIKSCKVEPDKDEAKKITEIMKSMISLCFEKRAPIILLKDGEKYINVNDDEEIDMTTHELKMIEPFSNYYSEGEYRFIEMENRVVIDVDSMEPWESYQKKVEENM